MKKNYYENLFMEGKGLHTCVIADYPCWKFFSNIHHQHQNINVHTFRSAYTYIESFKRIKSRSISYKNYDLIIYSSDALYDERTLEDLKKIAASISERKRVTLCYTYVDKDKENSSYVIESYEKGIKNYSASGIVEEQTSDPIQTANYLAELHMNLIQQKSALAVRKESESNKTPLAVKIDTRATLQSKSNKEKKLSLYSKR